MKTKQRIWSFDRELIMLHTDDIYFIESYQRKTTVHTASGSHRITAKLSVEEKALESEGFIRVHQSYLVKQDKIKKMCRYQILLTNETFIPVSRRYVKAIYRILEQTSL